MGESKNSYFRVRFNQKLKIGFRGTQVTSDGECQIKPVGVYFDRVKQKL